MKHPGSTLFEPNKRDKVLGKIQEKVVGGVWHLKRGVFSFLNCPEVQVGDFCLTILLVFLAILQGLFLTLSLEHLDTQKLQL